MASNGVHGRSRNKSPTGNGSGKRAPASQSSDQLHPLSQPTHSHVQQKELSPATGGWMNIPPNFGVMLTIFMSLANLAYTTGVVMTRVGHVEEILRSTTRKTEEISTVNVKMATVETKLTSIGDQITRIENALNKR